MAFAPKEVKELVERLAGNIEDYKPSSMNYMASVAKKQEII
jgi:hypothetical protein